MRADRPFLRQVVNVAEAIAHLPSLVLRRIIVCFRVLIRSHQRHTTGEPLIEARGESVEARTRARHVQNGNVLELRIGPQ